MRVAVKVGREAFLSCPWLLDASGSRGNGAAWWCTPPAQGLPLRQGPLKADRAASFALTVAAVQGLTAAWTR